MSRYFDGLNEKLLAALPAAGKVLECGCANGRLGQRYKQRNPHALWHGIDSNAEALGIAGRAFDRVFHLDLDLADLDDIESGYDLLVLGDVIEHLRDPGATLAKLQKVCSPHARLVCSVPNMSHIQVVERLLAGDLTYDPEGLLDRTHLRFFTPASIYKLLLDAGWMPNLADCAVAAPANPDLADALVEAAACMGMPRKTVETHLFLYQMIISCTRAVPRVPPENRMRLSVVVPVTNELQLQQNVLKSPGLREVDAEFIFCRGAATAAEALASGLARAGADWVVFCHQDVYFPRGFGVALSAALHAIAPAQARKELIGFAGIGTNQAQDIFEAGFVIDRLHRFDRVPADHAVSIDELAVVVSRDTIHEIDPALGWHLWATDLCLRAERMPEPHPARIACLPIFHNSWNDGVLPDAFDHSAAVLLDKYPGQDIIPTLCKCLVRD